jgi:hypothetical protein
MVHATGTYHSFKDFPIILFSVTDRRYGFLELVVVQVPDTSGVVLLEELAQHAKLCG